MNRLKRIALLGALTCAVLVGLSTGASASRGIGVSPGGSVTSTGVVTFTFSGVNVICNLSVTESINASISKVAGASVSTITAATLSACNDGTVGTFVSPGASTVTYTGFTGTLPTGITGVLGVVDNSTIQMRGGVLFPPSGCLYMRAYSWRWVTGPFQRIAIRQLIWNWVLILGSPCPPTMRGSGNLTPTSTQTLSLI